MSEIHEITAACAPVHCWSHDVDEDGPHYRACLECGHLYRTEAELVTEYNKGVREVNASPLPRWPGETRVPEITSVNDAWFCPLCMHDF